MENFFQKCIIIHHVNAILFFLFHVVTGYDIYGVILKVMLQESQMCAFSTIARH